MRYLMALLPFIFIGCGTSGIEIKESLRKTNVYSEDCLDIYKPTARSVTDVEVIILVQALEGCETRRLIRNLR